MKLNQYLPKVREQYEALPYPPRDPAEEKRRRDSWRSGSMIILAEQRRHTDAEVVHLDIAGAAIEFTRPRARAGGLRNISRVNESQLAWLACAS